MNSSLRRSPVPSFFGKAFLAAARLRVRQWDRALDAPEATQTAVLKEICAHAAKTEFGRAHDLGGVRSYADFRSRVPVGDYDSFTPAIDRMRRGEANVLVPEIVRYYGNSSGSSNAGRSKFLPISDRQIRQQTGSGVDSLFRYLVHRSDDDFTSGFTLGLFPPTTMKEDGPSFITSNPALMAVKKPKISQIFYLPQHADCAETPDYDRKLELIAERYLD